jgi:integrase
MINRRNHDDVQAHLAYRATTFSEAPGTRDNRWSALQTLLEWADMTLLSAGPVIRPGYPEYLSTLRYKGTLLAQSTVEGKVAVTRTFYRWAVLAYPRRYRQVTPLWIDTLRAPEMPSSDPLRDFYTLEDVEALLSWTDGSVRCERVHAAVAILFLTGMRGGALVTLPIAAVDVGRREVRQWTSLGVQTKFSKTQTAFMLEIPRLLEAVGTWDNRVREALPHRAMWYANLSEHPMEIKHVVAVFQQSRNRTRSLRVELQWLCAQTGVRYLSPHHLRHGFVVHAESHAETEADRVAISQNVGHADDRVTYGLYGRLKAGDRRDRIGRLGGQSPGGKDRQSIVREIAALLRELEE